VRLVRVGEPGAERPAVLRADDEAVLLPESAGDLGPAFFASGAFARLVAGGEPEGESISLAGLRIGAPIARPGKVVCIGLNYADHAAESGQPVPTEPILFMKDPSTVIGPNDPVHFPRGGTKLDWEVELGVVIGSTARYLDSREAALACVAGYAVAHDVSERAFQLERGGQWDKGKSCETFNPLGPWLVTADEVADPGALGLRLRVNGRTMQDSTTSDLIFDVPYVIWYLSQFMVLDPGDVVNTGTPAGVAMGTAGQPYLRPGDVVEVEIDGLGRQRQTFQQG
jgi:2-keto-4-pentenoate hydratase/2-oxohepta-3-ene-1,7-dioic acid hydratase in catechol pathway